MCWEPLHDQELFSFFITPVEPRMAGSSCTARRAATLLFFHCKSFPSFRINCSFPRSAFHLTRLYHIKLPKGGHPLLPPANRCYSLLLQVVLLISRSFFISEHTVPVFYIETRGKLHGHKNTHILQLRRDGLGFI